MARRYSAARIKSNRSYTIEEAAEVVGVTTQTVRQWVREGLPLLSEKRPFLILGWQLKSWLKEREANRARPLKGDEFYCLRCKAPRKAAFGLMDQTTSRDGRPMMTGFCGVCETICNRFLPRDSAA